MASVVSFQPDWSRLQQALTVEAERGFNNIEGKQHTFSEFLRLTLTAPPEDWSPAEQGRWQELGDPSELGGTNRHPNTATGLNNLAAL